MYLGNPAEHKCAIAVAYEGRLCPAMLMQDVSDRCRHVIRAQRLPGQANADVAPLQQDNRPGAEGTGELMDELKIGCLQAPENSVSLASLHVTNVHCTPL